MIIDSMQSISGFWQVTARVILRMIGWQVAGEFPDIPKYILVGAPHTSNWDFPFLLLLMAATGVRLHWIGKSSLFRKPYGWIFRRLGGIPVWRERKDNFVAQISQAFDHAKNLVVAISPEGTRSHNKYWKTGFYYMALTANVPIVLAFIDYPRRQVGVGPTLHTTGDIKADTAMLREFYADKKGLYPEKQGPIEFNIN